MTARVRNNARLADRGLDTAAERNGRREKAAKNLSCGQALRFSIQSIILARLTFKQRLQENVRVAVEKKYCNLRKIRTKDFDESPSFRPESEKHNFGIVSVCEYDNSKTILATMMKFCVWPLHIISSPSSSYAVFENSLPLTQESNQVDLEEYLLPHTLHPPWPTLNLFRSQRPPSHRRQTSVYEVAGETKPLVLKNENAQNLIERPNRNDNGLNEMCRST
ncbi:hypothetical protein AVEN_41508-1 [Araneus ventricosus]|uniref:Uncharacterized protein n=1 Tax=Araneus ventricosus TaxID=182803 RepID=A0A4Y2HBX4_ARAVE|nr:hypothetical protein AVEN_41508-1 [Araneus ventricosus]